MSMFLKKLDPGLKIISDFGLFKFHLWSCAVFLYFVFPYLESESVNLWVAMF